MSSRPMLHTLRMQKVSYNFILILDIKQGSTNEAAIKLIFFMPMDGCTLAL